MSRFAGTLLTIALFAYAASAAEATPVLFSGSGTSSGVTLNASANFAITGTTLTITLRNTGDSTGTAANSDLINNQLTGLFFDLPTGYTLTPVSAALGTGAGFVQANTCNTGGSNFTCSGTNVGGEFTYRNASAGFTGHNGNNGIASASYIGGSGPNFPGGVNLDNAGSSGSNDINFAIIVPRTATNTWNPSGTNLSGEPLIDGPVVFQLTIAGSGQLNESQISNVSFQYGKYLSDTHFYGSAGGSGSQSVPEPGLLLMAAPAFAWVARRIRRQRR